MANIIEYKGKKPVIGERVFLAEGARLIGDVEIGDDSSVFYNSVIRADRPRSELASEPTSRIT